MRKCASHHRKRNAGRGAMGEFWGGANAIRHVVEANIKAKHHRFQKCVHYMDNLSCNVTTERSCGSAFRQNTNIHKHTDADSSKHIIWTANYVLGFSRVNKSCGHRNRIQLDASKILEIYVLDSIQINYITGYYSLQVLSTVYRTRKNQLQILQHFLWFCRSHIYARMFLWDSWKQYRFHWNIIQFILIVIAQIGWS